MLSLDAYFEPEWSQLVSPTLPVIGSQGKANANPFFKMVLGLLAVKLSEYFLPKVIIFLLASSYLLTTSCQSNN
jgi:hypothetical protein